MAAAFDNSGRAFAAGISSLESAAWLISGTERHLVAGVVSVDSVPLTPTAVKRNGSGGTDLTQNGSPISFNSSSQYRGSIWELLAPAAASQTIYASFSGAQTEVALVGCSFTGIDQTTPSRTRTTNTANDLTTPATLTVTAANTQNNDLVTDFVCAGDTTGGSNPTLTVGGGQTERIKVDNGDLALTSGAMSTEPATGASVVMSWTGSTTSAVISYATFALPLIPAASVVDSKASRSNFAAQPMIRGPM